MYGEVERGKQDFGEKPEGKRPRRRFRRTWKDNIKMDIQEVGCGAQTESNWLRDGTDGGNL